MKTTAAACAPCPACESRDARRVCWTPWGGLIGPLLLGLVRCRACGCFTAVKARLPHEHCPAGKWPA